MQLGWYGVVLIFVVDVAIGQGHEPRVAYRANIDMNEVDQFLDAGQSFTKTSAMLH